MGGVEGVAAPGRRGRVGGRLAGGGAPPEGGEGRGETGLGVGREGGAGAPTEKGEERRDHAWRGMRAQVPAGASAGLKRRRGHGAPTPHPLQCRPAPGAPPVGWLVSLLLLIVKKRGFTQDWRTLCWDGALPE